MTPTLLPFVLIAVAVGAAVPMQSAISARTATAQGHPLDGAITNTAITTQTLLVPILTLRLPTPDLRSANHGPWWLWTGGLVGAAFESGVLFIEPRIDASSFVAATIFRSAVAALPIDHFGRFGFAQWPVSMTRLASVGCILLGTARLQPGHP
jgi:transporter family-2 protein